MQSDRIAIFTTVYPEGKRFLTDFFASLSAQIDKDFDLWIGLDRILRNELNEFVSDNYAVTFIDKNFFESNISLRQRAIEQMIDSYQSIIFVDSDDILAPTRVSAARASMNFVDTYGCAMKIIDEMGTDLGISFHKPQNTSIDAILPRFNIFGMSNTCYSSEILRKCLPFPEDCVLLDWFVATKAWMHEARMDFDPMERMNYRQYSSNTARVLPPFTEEQIIKSTTLVLNHYTFILLNISSCSDSKRFLIEKAKKYVELFYDSITQRPVTFHEYIWRLNKLPPNHIWWSCVAHPRLEAIWKN